MSFASIENQTYRVIFDWLPHHVSSFLEAEGKKGGAATAGSLSTPQIRFNVWSMNLVVVKVWERSKSSWAVHESWILFNVSGVGQKHTA